MYPAVVAVCRWLSNVGCRVLTVDFRVELLVFVDGSGCWVLAVVYRCRLSLTFSIVRAWCWGIPRSAKFFELFRENGGKSTMINFSYV